MDAQPVRTSHEHPAGTTRKIATGLTDSTHSSTSSSAERYQLDMFDTTPILLYKYREGVQTSSQKDLCAYLDEGMSPSLLLPSPPFDKRNPYTDLDTSATDERRRVTKKPLPRLTSYVEIKRHDLFLPEEKAQYADLPNYDSSLASIRVPLGAYLRRAVAPSGYENIYIVSHENGGSPSSSTSPSDVATSFGSLPPA